MAKKHRVLVIEDDSLFNNNVKLQLVLQENLDTIGIASTNEKTIGNEIEQTRPDAVIINDHLATAKPQLILFLLQTYPDLRIITVSLETNRINVYDNREVTVNTTKDLVSVITQSEQS